MHRLEEIFGPQGILARHLPSYDLRPQQLQMAKAVLQAIVEGRHLVVEAGTGVGKSFAYLVPAILAATDRPVGHNVVVATHTLNLQDQLIRKDIPFLQRVLPVAFTAVLAKGRANYVSLRRLELAYRSRVSLFHADEAAEQIAAIYQWALESQEGSLSELPFTPMPVVWDEVKSEADNCMGSNCRFYERCFYFRARRRIQQAKLVIANHSLYFVDMQLRRVGGALLPDHDVAIFDEAHMLEHVAVQHYGVELTAHQFVYNLRRIFNPDRDRGLAIAGRRYDQQQSRRVQELVQQALSDVTAFFEQHLPAWLQAHNAGRKRVRHPPARSIECALPSVMARLKRAVELLARKASPHESTGSGKPANRKSDEDAEAWAQEIRAAVNRLVTLSELLQSWLQQSEGDRVYWVESKSGRGRDRLVLRAAPIRVSDMLRNDLFDSVDTCVLTSATIAVGQGDFSFFERQIGLDGHPRRRTLQLGSPFRYEEQVTIHVVEDMPDPNDHPAYEAALAEAISHFAQRTGGRALVLFTAYRTMHDVASRIRPWAQKHEIQLLIQGESMPRHRLLEQFKAGTKAVLFGTDSFWQGIDVPGPALENVIITRLPFRVPDDPWLEAHLEALRSEGQNAFTAYQVPQAILKFRQGFGRLIRSSSDRGIVVILDRRIVTKWYGKLFLDSIPKCPIVVERLADLRREVQ